MKKNRMKNLPVAVGLLLILSVSIIISVECQRRSLADWTPPESLTGKWTGQSEVFASFKKGESPSEDAEDWIDIKVVVGAGGLVNGRVGEAELVDCTLKQNRNDFERMIGIKTDYVIACGLEKGIVQSDVAERRDISMPFNLIDGEFRGSLFEVESWKYPDPLFPRLSLTKEGGS